jgi:ABC-type transport system involved in cytochrome c biogenesis permease component
MKLKIKNQRLNLQSGQNMVEYLLLFAAVIVILMTALGPNGFLTKVVDNSLNRTSDIIDNMTNGIKVERYTK